MVGGSPLPFEHREAVDLPSALQDGIEPMWEDSRNKRGGRWLVSLAKQQRHIELDRLWLETVSWRRRVLRGRDGLCGSHGGSGLKDGRPVPMSQPVISQLPTLGPAAVSDRGEL